MGSVLTGDKAQDKLLLSDSCRDTLLEGPLIEHYDLLSFTEPIPWFTRLGIKRLDDAGKLAIVELGQWIAKRGTRMRAVVEIRETVLADEFHKL